MEEKHFGKELIILTNKLKRLLDKKHSKSGLYVGQARILNYLYRRKNEKTYQKDIENAFQIRGGSVTGMIDNLVSQNYIKRVESSNDKRLKEIVLTDDGEKIAFKSLQDIAAVEKKLTNVLTADEQIVFSQLLERISNWIDEEEKDEKIIQVF